MKPVDLKVEETEVVTAQQAVVREREASPLHRLATSILGVDGVANLKAEQYEAVRRIAILSIAFLVYSGTLGTGLISSLPDRGSKRPSKLARALRGLAARWRKRLVVYRDVPGPVPFRDREIRMPVDRITGLVVNPDKKAP